MAKQHQVMFYPQNRMLFSPRVNVDFVRSLLIISTNSGYKQMKIIQLARVSSQNIHNFV